MCETNVVFWYYEFFAQNSFSISTCPSVCHQTWHSSVRSFSPPPKPHNLSHVTQHQETRAALKTSSDARWIVLDINYIIRYCHIKRKLCVRPRVFVVFGQMKCRMGIVWLSRWTGLEILIPKHLWKSKIGPLEQIWAENPYDKVSDQWHISVPPCHKNSDGL